MDEVVAPSVVVRLDGELDAADATWTREVAAALEAGAPRVVVDMLNVTFIDSSVVRQLLLLLRRVPEGGSLRLVYTHHLIGRVIEIVGLADLFPQYSTVQAAVRNSPRGDGAVSTGVPQGHTDVGPGHRTGTSDPTEEV